MKRYVAVHCGCGYCGCDLDDVLIVDSDTTEEDIAEIAWQMALDNAESFAYVHFGWDGTYTEEEYEEYINNNVEVDWYDMTYAEYVAYCEENNFKIVEED